MSLSRKRSRAAIIWARTRGSKPASSAVASEQLLLGVAAGQDIRAGEVAGCGPVEQGDECAGDGLPLEGKHALTLVSPSRPSPAWRRRAPGVGNREEGLP